MYRHGTDRRTGARHGRRSNRGTDFSSGWRSNTRTYLQRTGWADWWKRGSEGCWIRTDSQKSSKLWRAGNTDRDAGDRYQGCWPSVPISERWKNRSVRWSWCRKDRSYPGTDYQYCNGAWRLFCIHWCRRTYPWRKWPLLWDDRIRSYQKDSDGIRSDEWTTWSTYESRTYRTDSCRIFPW